MSGRRLSLARVAGVAAWTAASVTWGTAGVAIATRPVAASAEPGPVTLDLPVPEATLAPVPELPESGLLILRYTPSAPVEPEVIVRRVVEAAPADTPAPQTATPAPAAAAPPETAAPAPPAPTKTTTKSSGS